MARRRTPKNELRGIARITVAWWVVYILFYIAANHPKVESNDGLVLLANILAAIAMVTSNIGIMVILWRTGFSKKWEIKRVNN